MTFFQVIAAAGIFCIVLVEVMLVATGIANATAKKDDKPIGQHKILVCLLALFSVSLPVIIERAVKLDGGIRIVDALFVTHLVFAFLFIASMAAIALKFNGEKDRARHWKAVMWHEFSLLGMLLTAMPLIPRLH